MDAGPQLRSYDTWTKKEDKLLISLVEEHGPHWTKISHYFANRNPTSVLQRHKRLLGKQIYSPWFFIV